MKVLTRRITRSIAALVLTGFGMGALTSPAHAAFWYPFGIQTGLAESTITGNGWTLCWSGTYDGSSSLSSMYAACDLNFIMLAGGTQGSSSYSLAAAGPRSSVFATTALNGTTYANGTYF